MLLRNWAGAIAAAVLCMATGGAQAQDMAKFPTNWEGQWGRSTRPGLWDSTKPPGLGQEAPLTPQYQGVLETNVKNQESGKYFDPKGDCYPPGMPRVMSIYQPMEIIIKPTVTYFLLESTSPIRRIWTDGRDWPKTMLPAFAGFSIGQWLDTDSDGKYDTLSIETRGISGKRLFDASIPLADDDSTVVKEKISLDKSNPDVMKNEITTTDSALTRPWTVMRQYRRAKQPEYAEYNCEERRNVVINGETYWIGVDGFLMPIGKDQPPPDLRYFNLPPK
ncbi:MAG: hypothetical protein QOG83_1301 [Alphaproteobacteria bacterium]|jgi:hypothetical protein|nr:hypothetical protein [Alphaproteobacteria bacterium]MEA2988590.1 hypothetical protein [Alphaproteobacteria bacterium]